MSSLGRKSDSEMHRTSSRRFKRGDHGCLSGDMVSVKYVEEILLCMLVAY